VLSNSTTLSAVGTTVLDANGNGDITLRPDVGQNWSPLFVRVSTSTRNGQTYCAVFHGSPGVDPQASQFIDDTFLGSGDASSMIAGTPVLFGEAVIFQFQGGLPGDTATATVFGQQSSLAPNLDLVPQVPGTHFAGHLVTETNKVLVQQGTFLGTTITPLTSLTFPSPGAGFDVSVFNSYAFSLNCAVHTATATAPPLQVTLTFLEATGGVAYQDIYEVFADLSANNTFHGGTVSIQDVVHSGRLQLVLTNNSPTISIDVNFSLTVSTKQLPGVYARQQSGTDGTLLEVQTNIGATGVDTLPLPLGYGDTYIKFFNNGAATMNLFLGFGSLSAGVGATNDFVDTIPATTGRIEPFSGGVPAGRFIFPKRAGIIHVQGTVGQNYGLRVISLFNKN
jgi:hypothetical protein